MDLEPIRAKLKKKAAKKAVARPCLCSEKSAFKNVRAPSRGKQRGGGRPKVHK